MGGGGGWSELFLEFFHRHNFLFMITCAHWLLSPMSQKRIKEKVKRSKRKRWKIHDIDEKEEK